MNRNDLYNSFHEIDDDVLERSENTAISKKKSQLSKWWTLAACMGLVFAMLFPVFHYKKWGTEKPAKMYLEGAVLQAGEERLIYHTDNFGDHILAFTLVLKNETPDCYVVFFADNFLKEWTDSEGVIHTENEQFQVITPCASFEPNFSYTVVDNILSITVNGEAATTIPTAPGTYEIVIDYGELYNQFDLVAERVEVCPFGSLIINSENFTK